MEQQRPTGISSLSTYLGTYEIDLCRFHPSAGIDDISTMSADGRLIGINEGVSISDDQGKYDEAIKAYIGVINDSYRVIRLSPGDLSKWVIQGDYVRRDNAIKAYSDAIMAYNEAIRLDPNDVLARYNKGIALKTLVLRYDMAIVTVSTRHSDLQSQ